MWMIQTTWILPRTRIKISTPRVSTALDALANQLRDQIQALKAEQETMLRELSTMTPMTPRRDSTHPKRCFICDLPDAHVIGPRNCPEVPILINEGLSSFNQVGRLMRPDDSDLPYGVHGGSGVAKALHDEHVTVLSAATSNSSSFQYSDPIPLKTITICPIRHQLSLYLHLKCVLNRWICQKVFQESVRPRQLQHNEFHRPFLHPLLNESCPALIRRFPVLYLNVDLHFTGPTALVKSRIYKTSQRIGMAVP